MSAWNQPPLFDGTYGDRRTGQGGMPDVFPPLRHEYPASEGGSAEPAAMRQPAALSVSEALQRAKAVLEPMVLVVEGEVSQYKDSPAYKAVYFPLSDGQGVMDCMMWRARYAAQGIDLRPGVKVRLTGRFSVYPAKGRMQFEVFSIELAGEGALRERVARLARKLEAEGLMDPSRKRPIPAFCQCVVVVTSPHGKVKDDVARTLRRRNPLVRLRYCPVQVEGAAAPAAMIEALRIAQAAEPDAILLVRGGGSYEDLMPFNDESLARAVASSRIPVITGIGHEPDTTICDMVSDRRASTPTAAAESVAPSVDELESALKRDGARLGTIMRRKVDLRKAALESTASRPVLSNPKAALVLSRGNQLDMAYDRLVNAVPNMVSSRRAAYGYMANRLIGLGGSIVDAAGARLEADGRAMRGVGSHMLEAPARRIAVGAGRLEALSPLAVLARGYSFVVDGDGHVVQSVAGLAAGDALDVRMKDGLARCLVKEVSVGMADGGI